MKSRRGALRQAALLLVGLAWIMTTALGPTGNTTVHNDTITGWPAPAPPARTPGAMSTSYCIDDPARLPAPPATPDGVPANYLHTCGGQLYDAAGRRVQITGVSWFGQESPGFAPHGLARRNWRALLDQIASLGFNTVRLPYANEMLRPGATVTGIDYQLNPDLRDLDPLQLLDRLIAGARERGLRVILDRHRPDSGGQSSLWYTESVPEERWIADWRALARRYRGNDTVIGVDLHNEPKDRATWGTGDPATDWRLAAERAGNAVLEENPYLLVFVQGIQWSPWNSYWWGGNLRAVRDHPVRLPVPNRVVYSPHDYGPAVFPQPWFWDGDYPDNLPAIWDQHWGYLPRQNIAPVVVGEFGGRSTGSDRDGIWQRMLVDYLADNGIGYLHWALNPDSNDTGGILADDWRSVLPERLTLVTRNLAPPLAVGTAGILGPPREALTVLARNALEQDGGPRFALRLRNEGPEAVALSRLTSCYWLSAVELGDRRARLTVEAKDIPAGQVGVELLPESGGGQRCLRLTFGEQAGIIPAYGEGGEFAVGIDLADQGSYTQVHDHSYTPGSALRPAERVTLYLDGALIWGSAPANATAPPPPAPPAARPRLSVPAGDRFWAGANYRLPPGQDIGGEAGPAHAGTAAAVEADFANLAAAGVRVIKWRLFGAANLPREANGFPGHLGPAFLADLDAALALAERHNLYLVFSLFDPALLATTCPAGNTPGNDLPAMIADGAKRRALLERIVRPLLDRTADSPRVLAYEIIAQPESGWDANQQARRSFVQETAAAIHAKGRALATVLAGSDSLAQWSALGLDYYSLRWSDQLATEQPAPSADMLRLDRPVVIGEFAVNSPRYGVGDLLALALREGYAGAFMGEGVAGEHLARPGEFLAWARRHWSEVDLGGAALPAIGQPLTVAAYGIDHLRLRADGRDLEALLRLRSGWGGSGAIKLALLPIGAGLSIAAGKPVRLSRDEATHLRIRFPGLGEGQGYQLSAGLWDEGGTLLARFENLATFTIREGELVAAPSPGPGNECQQAAARQMSATTWLAAIGGLAGIVDAATGRTAGVPEGEVEILDGVAPARAAASLPPGVSRETVVGGTELPVALAFAPDGRLFFGELHTGQIRVWARGAVQREPFYTLTVSGQPQAGLLALTVDPGFQRNHYVYVLYTAAQGERSGGLNGPNRLLRLTEVNGRGTAPQMLAADLPSDFVANGGGLRFGPDGYLYLGLGAGTNQRAAADAHSLAGKILRYSPDWAGSEGEATAGAVATAIYARGLGNPFGLAFHPATQQLYVTDAAGGTDELNLVLSGGNYGAPVVGVQHSSKLNDPLVAYWPARGISGLDFYRADRLPGWQNDLFYCNARRAELHRVRLVPPGFDLVLSDEVVTTGCQFAVASGPDGALYFSDEQGIYRLVGR